MDIRSSQLSPPLVPRTDQPGRILNHPKNKYLFSTAQGGPSNKYSSAHPSNQLGIMVKDNKSTDFQISLSLWAELQSLTATSLRNLDGFELKNSMMWGVEEKLAEAMDVRFHAANTSVEHAFFLRRDVIEIRGTSRVNGWSYIQELWTLDATKSTSRQVGWEGMQQPKARQTGSKGCRCKRVQKGFSLTENKRFWIQNTSRIIFDGVQKWLHCER